MQRDISSCNSYNYGDSLYWNARYLEEKGSFDWYQGYSALRPLVRKHIPTLSRILMVGCGNAVMSEDMVMDGYEDIMNIDISSVVIDIMKRKHAGISQLKYMQMDARDMSFFLDESFDCVIDKGTLDSLLCGMNPPLSAAQMLGEVSRLIKPGGIYMMITYGDPAARMPHLNRESWNVFLYNMPRPGVEGKSSGAPFTEMGTGTLPGDSVSGDNDLHYIYVCQKMDETINSNNPIAYRLSTEKL